MTARSLPARSEVPRQYTWNAESVFSSWDDWEASFASVGTRLPDLAEFKGHLGDSPGALADPARSGLVTAPAAQNTPKPSFKKASDQASPAKPAVPGSGATASFLQPTATQPAAQLSTAWQISPAPSQRGATSLALVQPRSNPK